MLCIFRTYQWTLSYDVWKHKAQRGPLFHVSPGGGRCSGFLRMDRPQIIHQLRPPGHPMTWKLSSQLRLTSYIIGHSWYWKDKFIFMMFLSDSVLKESNFQFLTSALSPMMLVEFCALVRWMFIIVLDLGFSYKLCYTLSVPTRGWS